MPDRRDVALEKEEQMTDFHILAIGLAKRSFQICATALRGVVLFNRTVSRAKPETILREQTPLHRGDGGLRYEPFLGPAVTPGVRVLWRLRRHVGPNKPSCLGGPAVACARSRGAFRCPVRSLDPLTGLRRVH
jgi:hypothetical protein